MSHAIGLTHTRAVGPTYLKKYSLFIRNSHLTGNPIFHLTTPFFGHTKDTPISAHAHSSVRVLEL